MNKTRFFAAFLLLLLPAMGDEKVTVVSRNFGPGISDTVELPPVSTGNDERVCSYWTPVMTANVKVSAGADLLVTWSANSRLFTWMRTQLTATAVSLAGLSANVYVRVLLDSTSTDENIPFRNLALEPSVWNRAQESVLIPANTPVGMTKRFEAERVSSYSFPKLNPGAGNHTLQAQAKVCLSFGGANALVASNATFNRMTMVVQEAKVAFQ